MQFGYTVSFGPRRIPRWYLLFLGAGFLVTGLVLFGLAGGGSFEAGQESQYLVCMALAAAFFVFGAGMLFFMLRASWRRARLLRIGQKAEATVLAVEPTWLAINDVTQLRVRYRFRDAERRQHEASSGPMPPEETADWKAGDIGIIYYDPQRPYDTAWTGERQPPKQNADNRVGRGAMNVTGMPGKLT